MKRTVPAPLVTVVPIALAFAVVLRRVLFMRETFVLRDNLQIVLPSREFLGGALRAGRLPEWCDWIGLGSPFAANPLHGVLYPPMWLVGLVPGPLGSDLVTILHLLAAAVGVAMLARALGAGPSGAALGGVAFGLGGYAASMVANNAVVPLAWMPWVAWAADRLADAEDADRPEAWRRVLVLGAVLAGQLAAGEPAQLSASLLLGVLVLVTKARRRGRVLLRAAASGAVGILLAAAIVLPALAVVGWTERGGGIHGAAATALQLNPLRLLQLVWPGLLGSPIDPGLDLARAVADEAGGAAFVPSWSMSVHLGAPVLALALSSAADRRARRLLLGAAAFVLLALGAHTPLYPLWRALSPAEPLARNPEKYLGPAMILASALAGAAFTRAFAQRRGPALPIGLAALGAVALPVAAAHGLRSALPSAIPDPASGPPLDVQAALAVSLHAGTVAAVAAALFAAALFLRRHDRLGRAPEALAFLVVAASTAWHAADLLPTAPRTIVAGPPRILAGVRTAEAAGLRPRVIASTRHAYRPGDRTGGSAIATVTHEHALPNVPARFGFAVFPGAESFHSAAVGRYLDAVDPLSSQTARLIGAEYLVVPTPLAPMMGLPPVAHDGRGAALLAVPGARPRAFVAARWRWSGPERILRATTAAPQALDAGHAWLEGEGEASGAPDGEPPVPCAVRSEVPERVALTCESRLGGYAVLLDEPAPGWSAELDGSAARIERADGLFRAVAVPPGAHRIVFSYRTPGLRPGIALSIAAAAAWLAAMALLPRRVRPAVGAGDPAVRG